MLRAMLPIKTKSVFKSRWIALLWAGGIVWSAAEFAGSQPHGGADANAQSNEDAGDVQALANAMSGLK
jgi:hypothetical protein